MYADDVQLYYSTSVVNVNLAVRLINEDLNAIFRWACANKLVLNPTKSKCLVVHTKTFSTENIEKLVINSTPIEYVDKAKNLGFTFNKTLSWNSHINEAISKTVFKLRSLWSTQHLIPAKIRMMIAKTYLVPTLLYGIEVFGNCDYESYQKLAVAFNNIARYVFAKRRSDHISSYADQIFGMPLKNYIQFKTLLFLHKILRTKEPSYLFDKILFAQSTRVNNIVPRRFFIQNSERQFFIFTVRLWNNLTNDLKRISSVQLFKNKLKETLSNA